MARTSAASAAKTKSGEAPRELLRRESGIPGRDLLPVGPRRRPVRSLRYRLAAITLPRLRYAFATVWFSGPFYPLTLGGIRPRQFAFVPPEPLAGDADRGIELMRGKYRFGGETVEGPDSLWRVSDAGVDWAIEIHGFDWLRDMGALGSTVARNQARELVDEWIRTQRRWRPLSWRPDVIARRLINWIGHARFLYETVEDARAHRFLDSIARQVRHLRRTAGMVEGDTRIAVLHALVLASLCLRSESRRKARWLRHLEDELAHQVHPDGGHYSRSPAIQFSVFRDLVELRAALDSARAGIPEILQHASDKMAPMLRALRHGDGGLALFNGANEQDSWLIDRVLAQAGSRSQPVNSAPHTGFQRARVNRTLILMDTGSVVPAGRDTLAHAGTLSFEMSVGRERLIVNCGGYAGPSVPWKIAQRTTAAHSTVTVGDVNSSEILAGGRIGRRARVVGLERRDSEGNIWVEAAHDGYRRGFGVIHRRRLYLAGTGLDLRGEDTLTGGESYKYIVRFHLHPFVEASLVGSGNSVVMELPGGSRWRFRAVGGLVALQESIYLGIRGENQRAEQIVVTGVTHDGNAQIKWAVTRIEDPGDS